MITTNEINEVTRSNNVQEQQFTIKATATSFQILSSGLVQ